MARLPACTLFLSAVLAAPSGAPRDLGPVWSYDVVAGPGGRELSVEAQLEGGATELTGATA